ncbi:hypothetical protein GOP47_0024127, partial [Adiantum capillus-veneris]
MGLLRWRPSPLPIGPSCSWPAPVTKQCHLLSPHSLAQPSGPFFLLLAPLSFALGQPSGGSACYLPLAGSPQLSPSSRYQLAALLNSLQHWLTDSPWLLKTPVALPCSR